MWARAPASEYDVMVTCFDVDSGTVAPECDIAYEQTSPRYWRLAYCSCLASARLCVCPVFFLTLIGRAKDTHRYSPGVSMRRGKNTFRPNILVCFNYFVRSHTLTVITYMHCTVHKHSTSSLVCLPAALSASSFESTRL